MPAPNFRNRPCFCSPAALRDPAPDADAPRRRLQGWLGLRSPDERHLDGGPQSLRGVASGQELPRPRMYERRRFEERLQQSARDLGVGSGGDVVRQSEQVPARG